MLFVNEGFTFRNFLVDAFAVFMFVVWFWLLITVFSDLFRRHDVSGWVKAIWVIALVVFPYLGIFAYLITQARGMAERNTQQAQQVRDELRRVEGWINHGCGIQPSSCQARPIVRTALGRSRGPEVGQGLGRRRLAKCLALKERATNEASRDPLRLPFICYPIGAQMALSCLWQDRNHEGDDIGHCL